MVALAIMAGPGPMEVRTVTLGRYFGVFDENNMLVAMAGERMRLDGSTEVSGVCTHPAHRGKGYAQILTTAITESVLERGDTAFLHVRDGNTGAAGVYKKLGFEVRAVFDIAAVIKE
jgi:predicted GNAT family acetyltransferase